MIGRGDDTSGGVFDRGAHEEDDPMIWEIPFISHEEKQAGWGACDRQISRGFSGRGYPESRKKKYTRSMGESKARGTGAFDLE